MKCEREVHSPEWDNHRHGGLRNGLQQSEVQHFCLDCPHATHLQLTITCSPNSHHLKWEFQILNPTAFLSQGARAGLARGRVSSSPGRSLPGRQWRHAAVAERQGAESLLEGLTGALESGLAKLQRVLQGRPAGFPPGVCALYPDARITAVV